MAPSANFHLPVVFENLRGPESLHQLIDSLEALDNVAEQIFTRITKRVEENRSSLAAVRTRLASAEVKIANVAARSGEATTIFSPKDYPAAKALKDYETVNQGGHDVKVLKRAQFSLPPISAEEEEKERSTVEDSSLFEYSANAVDASVDTSVEGLGKLPANLASVSSLLLFNTSQNPYKKYTCLDTLIGADDAPEPEPQETGLPKGAPKSVATASGYEGLGKSDISYQPGATALPQFNLAANLPLPGAPVANRVSRQQPWSSPNDLSEWQDTDADGVGELLKGAPRSIVTASGDKSRLEGRASTSSKEESFTACFEDLDAPEPEVRQVEPEPDLEQCCAPPRADLQAMRAMKSSDFRKQVYAWTLDTDIQVSAKRMACFGAHQSTRYVARSPTLALVCN